MIFPSVVLYISNNLVQNVQNTITQQLYIDYVYDGYTFDGYVNSDPNFITNIYRNNQRVMVLRDLRDFTNRNLADLVLFFTKGMLVVECNRFGPTLQIAASNITWSKLCLFASPTPRKCNWCGTSCGEYVYCGSCSNNTCGSCDGYINDLCNGCGNCYAGCVCTITCGCSQGCAKCAFTSRRPYSKPDKCKCPTPFKGSQGINQDFGHYVPCYNVLN